MGGKRNEGYLALAPGSVGEPAWKQGTRSKWRARTLVGGGRGETERE